MLNLYTSAFKKTFSEDKYTNGEKIAIAYHSLFDYPLTFSELIKWKAVDETFDIKPITINRHNGYFYLEGQAGHCYQRILRKKISLKKMGIARKAAKILSFIPTIKMIAVTGSLAMGNSTDEGDIDLMIVTSQNALWKTRIATYFVLRLFGFGLRKPMDPNQKDKLCLNIWLDEKDLVFHTQNIYSSHEIGQIVPLINKNKTYEKFLWNNKWVLKYWPNSVKIIKIQSRNEDRVSKRRLIENLAYRIQLKYMKSKITRETISPTRALFHPQDWGSVVLDTLESHFIQ